MVVKDTSGATVGTVVQVGKATNGLEAVVVNIDGKPISLAANVLTPAGDGMVSSVTKDQIKAAAAKQSAG
jgi:ligand-binding sensor protein